MRSFCVFAICVLFSVSVCSAASLSGCAGQIFSCFVNPCQFAKCSYPNAHCVADYCNGCNAVWYHGHIRLTTEQCAGTTTLPPF